MQRAGPRVGLVLEERAVRGLDGIAEHPLGLLGVEDGERAREPNRLAMRAQRAMADAVKSPAPETGGFDAGEFLHAVEHLAGGLVGEGEQQDLAGPDALRKQVGHAVGEGARLTRAGAGEDQQRARFRRHRGELLVVQLRAEVDRRDAVRRGRGVEGEIHEAPNVQAKARRGQGEISPAAKSSGHVPGFRRTGRNRADRTGPAPRDWTSGP